MKKRRKPGPAKGHGGRPTKGDVPRVNFSCRTARETKSIFLDCSRAASMGLGEYLDSVASYLKTAQFGRNPEQSSLNRQ